VYSKKENSTTTLTTMQARERHDKTRKLTDELKVVRAENQGLRQELQQVLAMKAAARQLSAVEQALAKYAAEKGGEHNAH